MGNKSAAKGKRFERETVNEAKAFGLDAERAYGSNGEAIGEHRTVDVRIERFVVQNKREERIAKKFILTENYDGILYRKNFGESHIAIRYAVWLHMLKLLKDHELLDELWLALGTSLRARKHTS